MGIAVACRECGRAYDVSPARAGHAGRCLCGNLIPVPGDLPHLEVDVGLPIMLGHTREQVARALGQPTSSQTQREGRVFAERFDEHGLGVIYDHAGEQVVKIRTLETGFHGAILGVSLRDSAHKCLSLWGQPSLPRAGKGAPSPLGNLGYTTHAWRRQGYWLSLQVWSRRGHDPDFGSYAANTVKQILLALEPE